MMCGLARYLLLFLQQSSLVNNISMKSSLIEFVMDTHVTKKDARVTPCGCSHRV